MNVGICCTCGSLGPVIVYTVEVEQSQVEARRHGCIAGQHRPCRAPLGGCIHGFPLRCSCPLTGPCPCLLSLEEASTYKGMPYQPLRCNCRCRASMQSRDDDYGPMQCLRHSSGAYHAEPSVAKHA